MSAHGDLGPELRRLAQVLLDRLDPAVRLAATAASGSRPGRCEQVWCPVCALAALITGEQHPLITVVADHSVALMTVISAMVADAQRAADGVGPPQPPTDADATPPPPGTRNGVGPQSESPTSATAANGRYQHIPVTVEATVDDD